MRQNTLPVVEQFDSIQGEGPSAGHLASFVRLAGCPLQCDFCDTPHAWDEAASKWSTATNIAQTVQHKLVVITGGEPFVHDFGALLDAILTHDDKARIEVETSGAVPTNVPLHKFHKRVQLIVSPKPVADYAVHYTVPPWAIAALKYLATPDLDAEFIAAHALRHAPHAPVFIQPLWDDNASLLHALWMLAYDEHWRLSPQLHKMIGVR